MKILERTGSLRIFVEGPSCSGKTTALQRIESQEFGVVYKSWPKTIPNPAPVDFFLDQDADKLARTQTKSQPIVLVDRGPLSTLTFYSVAEEQRNIVSNAIFRWYWQGLRSGKLFHPDAYLFINCSASNSLTRATSARTIDENNMWLLYPDRISYWYNRLLQTYEYGIPVYHFDGSLSPEMVAEQIKYQLHKIRYE